MIELAQNVDLAGPAHAHGDSQQGQRTLRQQGVHVRGMARRCAARAMWIGLERAVAQAGLRNSGRGHSAGGCARAAGCGLDAAARGQAAHLSADPPAPERAERAAHCRCAHENSFVNVKYEAVFPPLARSAARKRKGVTPSSTQCAPLGNGDKHTRGTHMRGDMTRCRNLDFDAANG